MQNSTQQSQIKKITIRQQLVDYFIKKIETGEYAVGQSIPSEISLAEEMQVSRNILREAMKGLEDYGILSTINGKGSIVASNAVANIQSKHFFDNLRNDATVLQLLDTRLIIEPQIAFFAAQRRTEEDLLILLNPDKNVFDLHIALAEMCKNDTLLELLKTILLHLKNSPYDELHDRSVKDIHEKSAVGHQAIIDAVVRQDAEAAYSLMYEHLNNRIESIKTFYNLDEEEE